MTPVQSLIQASTHITPESAQQVMYHLQSNAAIDLIQLYFSDRSAYQTIKRNISTFIAANKHAYNLQGDGMTDFMVNVSMTPGLFDNFLLQPDDLDVQQDFLRSHQDFFARVVADPSNSFDVICKIEGIYTMFLQTSLVPVIQTLTKNQIESRLGSYKHTIYILLFSPMYSHLFTGDVHGYIYTNSLADAVIGLIINGLSAHSDGSFESFIINNYTNLGSVKKVFIPDRDFNLLMQVLISPLDLVDKQRYIQDMQMKHTSLADIVLDDFDLTSIQGDRANVIVGLYQAGFTLHIPGDMLDYPHLPFVDMDAKHHLAQQYIQQIDVIEPQILCEILYHYDPVSSAYIYTRPDYIDGIYRMLDPAKMDLDVYDHVISLVQDTVFQQETYKSVYTAYQHPLMLTLVALPIDAIQDILVFNTDIHLEKQILQLLATKLDTQSHNDIYIRNLLDESSFVDKTFLFDYKEIIYTLGQGRGDIETIEMIMKSPAFLQTDVVKIGNFVNFLIDHQQYDSDKLHIIDLFFGCKSSFDPEFFDTVFGDILLTYINKKNILTQMIDQIGHDISDIYTVGAPSWMSRITSFFVPTSSIDLLKHLKQMESTATKLDTKSKTILQKSIADIDQILAFVVHYRTYISGLYLTIQFDELKLARERMVLLAGI